MPSKKWLNVTSYSPANRCSGCEKIKTNLVKIMVKILPMIEEYKVGVKNNWKQMGSMMMNLRTFFDACVSPDAC